MIPYGRQQISAEDMEAVRAVLGSDFLTQGPAVPAFERAVADYVGAPHAVAVNSATSALHVACLALDLGPGDLAWTSPNSFLASANCARYCGAEVDFVDIDPHDLNLSVPALRRKLEEAAARGRLPKVLIPVDFAGRSADLQAMRELADRYGFAIVEDASHAIGATYRGHKVGGHGWADITVFSFHPVKIITSGEGGMALTHRPELARRMELARSHGMTRDPSQMGGTPHGSWYYEQVALGWNYRMTDLQGALGTSQLGRIEAFLARRQAIRARYDRGLAQLPLWLPAPDRDGRSALHLYPIQLAPEAGRERRTVFDELRAGGIGVNVHYIPIHTQPYYRALGFRDGDFPAAEAYYARAITLPLHAGMTDADTDAVIAAVQAALA
ncbi:UDP-4-amino-4,6-dideoxy-N-acetyl-beta-L-altrosamine transaminase [Ramlibacter sp.]|uniref:UDP-4-amino-4, 6-dideoxy-N-acetyl-beta-L-altrosamine transaminase n=1 Tax=Ramlibacter sp. TaxID=1917967 RepID=UPI002D5C55C7|nr:UDP-4-amino-4,6-dideoxy-N-acetyl-beta-L-altrosamine transaminase [Ramlibacter sp.]HYD74799.1 UDP-4-amino-4,6-dideoxy-N-acetyl-beta-L-altrosamine transaminase [Ramlibacter sp.]